MQTDNLICEISEFLQDQEIVYLCCNPEIVDFRKQYEGKICLHTATAVMEFYLPQITATFICGLESILNIKILLTWDIKRLLTYFYFNLPKNFTIDLPKIIDIKYQEAFFGINNTMPQSLKEATKRVKSCDIHQSIHIPLATKVLPKIETLGFNDKERKKTFCSYEIEGQTNGRLGCKKEFNDAVLVHHLDRSRYYPNQDCIFAELDFKAAEVCVLQWLSKDQRLGKIIESGRDIYQTIAFLFDAPDRKFVKEFFLPTYYGMQPKAFSERMNISLDEAKQYYDKVYKFFGTSMEWLDGHVDNVKINSVSVDYFGRPRNHSEKPWSVRNSVVQSVAAIFFQEKLIKLSDSFEVFANVHDAYFLYVLEKEKDLLKDAIDILESPSELIPNLKIKVECKIGLDLDKLVNYNRNRVSPDYFKN